MKPLFSSVGARLGAGFGLLILLAALLTGIGYFRMAAMQQDLEGVVGDDIIRIRLTNAMREAVAMQGIALRDVVLQIDFSQKKKELALARESRKRYQAAVTDLRNHLAAYKNDSMEQRIAKTETLDAQVQKATVELLEFALAEQNAEAGAVVRDKIRVAQVELRSEIESMLNDMEKHALESAAAATSAAQFAKTLMLGLCAAVVILGTLIAVLIMRGITRPLADTVDASHRIAGGDLTVRINAHGDDEIGRLQTAFGEMVSQLQNLIGSVKSTADKASGLSRGLYAAAHQILGQADQQSSMAASTNASMQRMAQSIDAVSSAVDRVGAAADHASKIAKSGHTSVRSGAESSQQIVLSVDSSSRSIGELSDAINRIVSVTQVISEIAEQTNLLALNAAIEAARAGEQGRGFAVVADEVRKLAERTSASTADIQHIIDGVASRTRETVAAMEAVKQAVDTGAAQNVEALAKFEQILDAAGGVAQEAGAILGLSREQSAASRESRETVAQIANIAADSVNNIRHLEESAQTLTATADELRRLVDRFRIG
jgi:methyl-accepting chemotaxis protein